VVVLLGRKDLLVTLTLSSYLKNGMVDFLEKKLVQLIKKGYYQVKICGVFYKKHRIIWKLVTRNDPISYEIDNINLIKSDNKFDNLRLCSGSQNCHNQYKRNNNTSGHKGVTFDKSSNKWRASFMFENKHVHVGRYGLVSMMLFMHYLRLEN